MSAFFWSPLERNWQFKQTAPVTLSLSYNFYGGLDKRTWAIIAYHSMLYEVLARPCLNMKYTIPIQFLGTITSHRWIYHERIHLTFGDIVAKRSWGRLKIKLAFCKYRNFKDRTPFILIWCPFLWRKLASQFSPGWQWVHSWTGRFNGKRHRNQRT